MKSKNDEITQRVLMLLKIDAKNVFDRIKRRKSEYLEIFALRRTREHFPVIFNNRYAGTSLKDLSLCSTDLITGLDQFYTLVDEMSWYLYQTEDMPNTVETYIDRKISRMERVFETLNLYLDAELGILGADTSALDQERPQFIDRPVEPALDELFPTEWKDDTSQDA
jgi:hypothetical protein